MVGGGGAANHAVRSERRARPGVMVGGEVGGKVGGGCRVRSHGGASTKLDDAAAEIDAIGDGVWEGGITGDSIGGRNLDGGGVAGAGVQVGGEVGGGDRSSMMRVSRDIDLVIERVGERWIRCAGDHSDAGTCGGDGVEEEPMGEGVDEGVNMLSSSGDMVVVKGV
jgi:hypothetical protein